MGDVFGEVLGLLEEVIRLVFEAGGGQFGGDGTELQALSGESCGHEGSAFACEGEVEGAVREGLGHCASHVQGEVSRDRKVSGTDRGGAGGGRFSVCLVLQVIGGRLVPGVVVHDFGDHAIAAGELEVGAEIGLRGFSDGGLCEVDIPEGLLDLSWFCARSLVCCELIGSCGIDAVSARGELNSAIVVRVEAEPCFIGGPCGEAAGLERGADLDVVAAREIDQLGWGVDEVVVVEVWTVVALFVDSAGADIAGVGGSEKVLQLVFVGLFLLIDAVDVLVEDTGGAAQCIAHQRCLSEGVFGVDGGAGGALEDLFEVGFAGGDFRRGDVESDGICRETQTVEVVLESCDEGTDILGDADQFVQFRHGGAVDFADAFLGRFLGKHGIGGKPVEVCSLGGAGSPVVDAPVAGFAGGGVLGGISGTIEIGEAAPAVVDRGAVEPSGEVEDLVSAAGDCGGGGGELSFVIVVDGDWLSGDVDAFALRNPCEEVVVEELVVSSEGGEVVAVGVAMALREEAGCVVLIEVTIGSGVVGFFVDLIVAGVDGLAGEDAAGVVPIETVVGWGDGGSWGEEIVTTTEEGESFFEEVRDLPFESEAG